MRENRADEPFDEWIAAALMGSLTASLVSIAASGIFLAIACSLWLAGALRRRRVSLRMPPFGFAVALFMGAAALSIAASEDPLHSSRYVVKLVKFILLLLVFNYFRRRHVAIVFRLLAVAMTLSALYGILQYLWLLDVNLLNRIRGFMGHWMTFSGQMMLATVSLFSFLLIYERGAREPSRMRTILLSGAALAVSSTALLLTFTRNAWLGALIGAGCVLTVGRRLRWLLPGGLILALLFLALPQHFKQRLWDGFNLRDTTTQTRLELLQTGARMVADHPLTGVGPRMVPTVAQRYRQNPDFPDWLYQHLHNSPMQVAAEMGLLGLSAWMALWVVLLRDFRRLARQHAADRFARWTCVNGICAVAAFLASGLLEYNFGDSELLNLMVFLVTAPYVVCREPQPASS